MHHHQQRYQKQNWESWTSYNSLGPLLDVALSFKNGGLASLLCQKKGEESSVVFSKYLLDMSYPTVIWIVFCRGIDAKRNCECCEKVLSLNLVSLRIKDISLLCDFQCNNQKAGLIAWNCWNYCELDSTDCSIDCIKYRWAWWMIVMVLFHCSYKVDNPNTMWCLPQQSWINEPKSWMK